MTRGPLRIVVVHPDLLGTYGDGGNGLVLLRRATWRGYDATLVQAPSHEPLPLGDLYCLGGGEDGPQVRSATELIEDGRLVRAVEDGAVVFGVCAGFQLLGTTFPDARDQPRAGLGLLDLVTRKGPGPRAVGELTALIGADGPPSADGAPWPKLTGFENHGGVSTLGPGSRPLARVETGVGNGDGSGIEGAWSGRVVGTYLHGPVLARNPALADLLLSWAVGESLDPLDDHDEEALRAERLAAARSAS